MANQYVKCRGCGKEIPCSNFKYCHDCGILEIRLQNKEYPPEVRAEFWAYIRQYGHTCAISGVSLIINDSNSPWYLVFCHLNPGSPKIVPVAAVINGLKSASGIRAFKPLIGDLDDHRQKHMKMRKRPIVHWRLGHLMGHKACHGCGGHLMRGHKFCARCSKINHRMQSEHYSKESMDSVWEYLHRYGFVDYYTEMKLNLHDPQSPWYLVFDHWMPRDPRRIVLTSALINEMKSDLTEDEFWYLIHELANHFRCGTPVRKIKLKCWSRRYR